MNENSSSEAMTCSLVMQVKTRQAALFFFQHWTQKHHMKGVSQEKVSPTPLRHDGRACRDVILENRLLIHHWDLCLG